MPQFNIFAFLLHAIQTRRKKKPVCSDVQNSPQKDEERVRTLSLSPSMLRVSIDQEEDLFA